MMLLAAKADDIRRRRIVVVDDSRDFADTLAALLVRRGYDARAAYDGHQALALATEFEPEAIICDLVMPGIDGYELARCVRHDRDLSGTLLVAVTGFPAADTERRARRAGFDGFFLKPIEGEALIRLLERMGWRRDDSVSG